MVVTVYLFHNVMPKRELNLFRCIKCGRPMFKFTADEIVIANVALTSFDAYPIAAHYIEHQCHSCGTQHNVLFQ